MIDCGSLIEMVNVAAKIERCRMANKRKNDESHPLQATYRSPDKVQQRSQKFEYLADRNSKFNFTSIP